jgi:hypothetical protein
MAMFGLFRSSTDISEPGFAPGRFVQDAFKAGKIVVVETRGDLDANLRLRADHAYTVTGVENGKVRVRDPITGDESLLTSGELTMNAKRVTAGEIP